MDKKKEIADNLRKTQIMEDLAYNEINQKQMDAQKDKQKVKKDFNIKHWQEQMILSEEFKAIRPPHN